MQVEAMAVQLRPRPMPEAADLGAVLVHRHARSIVRAWGPVYLAVVILSLACVEIAGWLPAAILWWMKPWLDRTLLFVMARAVFGQATTFTDVWQSRSALWWKGLLSSLTLRRLSPWRSYTQPIAQLEGQTGRAHRQRRNQLLRGKRGAAGMMHFVFANAEMVLALGLVGLAIWFAPEGSRQNVLKWLFESDSMANALVGAVLYAAVVFVLEPFYVAAGFLMYLNRRVELEAWDIEQEFRRAFG